jgi:antitoxin CptB
LETRVDKARLRWLCRRGMKELDVLLERFLLDSYDELVVEQQQTFMRLLQTEDPDLMAMLLGKQDAPDSDTAALLELLRNVH